MHLNVFFRYCGIYMVILSPLFILGGLVFDFVGKSLISPSQSTWGIWADTIGSFFLTIGWSFMKYFGTNERYTQPRWFDILKILGIIILRVCWTIFAYGNVVFKGLEWLRLEMMLNYFMLTLSVSVVLWPTVVTIKNPRDEGNCA
jgi:hypothetical protein